MINKAIVIVGLARTGKDTAADYISEKYGYFSITLSDMIVGELGKRGLENTKMNQAKMGDSLREERGMDAVAQLGLEKAEGKDKVVFVGARSVEEVDLIKRNAGKIIVIKLESTADNRVDRKGDLIDSDHKTLAERDKIDIEKKGLGKLLEKADITISNNGSQEQLYEEIDEALRNI